MASGSTIAHVPPDRRHALRDLGRIVGPDVDVGHAIGRVAGGLHVDAETEIGIGDEAVEQRGRNSRSMSAWVLRGASGHPGLRGALPSTGWTLKPRSHERVRLGLDGLEVQARGLEIFSRELGLLGTVLDDHRARRRTNPCGPGALKDRPSRPCAPALRDRAPIAASAQMFELDDVAAMRAAGEAAEAAVAVET